MATSIVKWYFEEFPFLSNFLDIERINKFRVSRVDAPLLREVWSSGITELILLDKSGKKILRVGWAGNESTFWGRVRMRSFTEDVLSALLRVPADKEAGYVLYIEPANGPPATKENAVLYKPPKGFSLQQWASLKFADLVAELKQGLDAIDKTE